ncbi:cytochrome bd-I ubiquinol oxidase subunit 2 apoprotein [Poseidonocella pacifica]|uniref:Cytochrome bd-I ubiquinol oxidase subunit 2 apoprotein n=1 Tax=Poseidonocella pacifica TaxID=871651 RepID=A0A1I0WGL0_9RHOB|nr:cytochrome d ubiquinol oxidase subunit II [Poseidonocella pacifica]SFA87899.1 cytochrome bd-I ubiquinol oxidase subunit 2 apoprotein [Poseidonocella pacifica]
MFEQFGDPAVWLPFVFASLMGFAILIYVVLDGFDLGVGLLFPFASRKEKDEMIASIGPFWDANETWLVLSIGVLLVAFPVAHGVILSALYLPVAVMLIGLVLRGVAFEFRLKTAESRKDFWNWLFFAGSLLTALSQGAMLGLYIMGLRIELATLGFAAVTSAFLVVGYSAIGSAWLLIKAEGELQLKALGWAKGGIWGLVAGMAAISAASPLVSTRIFDKWFALPQILWLVPLPIIAIALIFTLWVVLNRFEVGRREWLPFAIIIGIFVLAFAGMAYSFYPYVVPDRITIYEAASAPESLIFILVGTCIVLPCILGYTILAYTIFGGKASGHGYESH